MASSVGCFVTLQHSRVVSQDYLQAQYDLVCMYAQLEGEQRTYDFFRTGVPEG